MSGVLQFNWHRIPVVERCVTF